MRGVILRGTVSAPGAGVSMHTCCTIRLAAAAAGRTTAQGEGAAPDWGGNIPTLLCTRDLVGRKIPKPGVILPIGSQRAVRRE
jgi:hypothetical protein